MKEKNFVRWAAFGLGQAKRKSRLIGRIVNVRQWATAAGALTLTAGLLGAPWNSDGALGDVRMVEAARAGDTVAVQALIRRRADVNASLPDGTTALHWAAQRGDLVLAILNARFDIAKLLLERGADPNIEDPHGAPLHVLAFLRRAQNDALSSYLPRQLPEGGFDSEALTLELLARGADINARYAHNSPPKHVAIGRFRVPFTGATPFFIAAITGDAPYMRFLAPHGADPSMGTRGNITPLLGASGIGALVGDTPASAEEAVKAAYELGNDPTATVLPSNVRLDPSWANATALHGAATIGSNDNDMVQWLVDQGVPLDATSQRGANPYQVAAGLEGTIFNPWPETAAFILTLAEERGITRETSEVPPPPMARTPQ